MRNEILNLLRCRYCELARSWPVRYRAKVDREQALALLCDPKSGTERWNSWRQRADKHSALPSLAGANFESLDLSGIDLSGLDLVGVNFRDCRLRACNLSRAQLDKAALEDADLKGAQLMEANLGHANLRGSNLDGANLSEARLCDADLKGAHLLRARLQQSDLRRADLRGAYLRSANLRGARLDDARLDGAFLKSAYLRGVHLTTAQRDAAYLDNAQLDALDESAEDHKAPLPQNQRRIAGASANTDTVPKPALRIVLRQTHTPGALADLLYTFDDLIVTCFRITEAERLDDPTRRLSTLQRRSLPDLQVEARTFRQFLQRHIPILHQQLEQAAQIRQLRLSPMSRHHGRVDLLELCCDQQTRCGRLLRDLLAYFPDAITHLRGSQYQANQHPEILFRRIKPLETTLTEAIGSWEPELRGALRVMLARHCAAILCTLAQNPCLQSFESKFDQGPRTLSPMALGITPTGTP